MERTYKQELELAEKNNIDIYKLKIAYEVSCFLVDNIWWAEEDLANGTMDELFEDICSCVGAIWLSLDNNYSLSNIVEAIIRLHTESKIEIKDINKYMVIEYIQDNF